MLDDFKKFLFRGNVIDLAVAVDHRRRVHGRSSPRSPTGLITPLVGMIFSKDFTTMTFDDQRQQSSATAS